jgi:hypothetical protein
MTFQVRGDEGVGFLNELPDNFRKRQKIEISDEKLIEAAYNLSARQFEAWKLAVVHGYSDAEIADALCTFDKATLPGDVRSALKLAAKNGYPVPGDPEPKKYRARVKEPA